jgi:hypothetical protein
MKRALIRRTLVSATEPMAAAVRVGNWRLEMRNFPGVCATRLKKTCRRAFALPVFLLLALALQGTAMAQSATVMTDKTDYAPGDPVTITGSGWQPGETVTLQFAESPLYDTPPNLSAVADANGNIFNNQFSPDSYDVKITFTLTATGNLSGLQAQTTFTDSRTVTAVTLNGASAVTVAAGAAISASVTVNLNSGFFVGDQWDSSGWRISTTAPPPVTCVDTPNHSVSGFFTSQNFTETFNITAPATVGTYNAYFIAYQSDGTTCNSGASSTFTMTNAVTVYGPAAKLAFSQQPANAAAGTSISPAITVLVQDSSGNTVLNSSASITMAIANNPGGGTLSGTTTVNAVNGVATFSNLSINKAGTPYTLTASSTGLTGATSNNFNITPGTATQLIFTTPPSTSGTAATPWAQQPVVTVEDAFGNVATNYNTGVTLAINTGTGTLTCTTNPVTPSSGVATFSGCSLDKATSYTLKATSGTITDSTTHPSITISVGPATKLGFGTQPSNTQAGSSISPAVTVQVQDAGGNVVTSSSASIGVAIGTNPGGGTLSGTTPVNAINGVATFSDLSINKTGTGYTLSATSTGLTTATSSNFNITPGPATKLAFTTQPGGTITGGTAFPTQPVVTVEDALGNTVTTSSLSITLTITAGTPTSGGPGTLTCTTDPLNASSGVATFAGCRINTTGTGYQLHAAATGVTAADSSAFNVNLGPATKLAFGTQPSNTVAGSQITPAVTVQVQDAGGNVVTTSSASIAMAIGTNPGGGTLSGTTPVNASSGVATFSNLSINKTGTGYTLSATSTGLTTATSNTFNTTPGSATQLIFTTQPSTPDTAGTAFGTQPRVSVEDANGNVVTTDGTDAVTLAITNGTGTAGATLTCTTNPVTVVSGVATFAGCNINLAGSGYTLTATSGSLTSAVSTAITINHGTATKLVFTTQPDGAATGGTAFPTQPVVTVEDAFGNTVNNGTGSNASITLAIGTNPSGGTLTCTNNTVTASAGVATFANCRIDKAGNGYTLTASASGLTGATSNAFNVAVGPAAKLGFGQQPTNTAAGSISPAVTVQVQDAGGNVVTTSSASIAMAIGTNPGGGTLSGTTPVNAASGVATFSDLSINKTGTGYTLSATSNGLTTATSSNFNITPGPATKLAFTRQPGGTITGGTAFPTQPIVTVEDALGNTVTTSSLSITLTITAGTPTTGGPGTLTCTTNPLSASSGVATFASCNINTAGTGYQLHAAATGVTAADSSAFNVTVGAAAKLAFGTQPSDTFDGLPITPAVTVQVQDAGGNLVTTASNSITIAIGTNPGGGTLSGTKTVNASSGVATFSTLSINKTGTGYTLTASATGLTGATSSTFNILAGAATKLVFGTQPSNTAQSFPIYPAVTVQVEDAGGNVVTTSSAAVSMAIGTNPSSGTLSGILAVNAVNGVATFTNLAIDNTGTGYTLVASSLGLTPATSNAFNIVVPSATYIQPFNSGHGWSYTQTGCSVGIIGSCTPSASAATNCATSPCVDASVFAGLQTGGDETGYFQNPAGYTWQTLGVPANAIVTSVEGGWYDNSGGLLSSCATGTTAGIQIFDSTNGTEITTPSVVANIATNGDTSGVTHALGSPATVNTGYQSSSTGITLRFNLNVDTAGFLGTCTLYADNFQLLITYTSGGGGAKPRKGQVVIAWNGKPHGTVSEASAYNVKLSGAAAPLTWADLKPVPDGRSGFVLDPSALKGKGRRVTKVAKE